MQNDIKQAQCVVLCTGLVYVSEVFYGYHKCSSTLQFIFCAIAITVVAMEVCKLNETRIILWICSKGDEVFMPTCPVELTQH